MAEQRDEAWLKAATPDQIVKAEQAGELDNLLGRVRKESGCPAPVTSATSQP